MHAAVTGRNASEPRELRETGCHADADENAAEAKGENINDYEYGDTNTAARAAAEFFARMPQTRINRADARHTRMRYEQRTA